MRGNQRHETANTTTEFLEFRNMLKHKYRSDANLAGFDALSRNSSNRESKYIIGVHPLIDRSNELRSGKLEQKFSKANSDAGTKRKYVSEMLSLMNSKDGSDRRNLGGVQRESLAPNIRLNSRIGSSKMVKGNANLQDFSFSSNRFKSQSGDFKNRLASLAPKDQCINSNIESRTLLKTRIGLKKDLDTPLKSNNTSKASRSIFEELNFEIRSNRRSHSRINGLNGESKKISKPLISKGYQKPSSSTTLLFPTKYNTGTQSSGDLYNRISTSAASSTTFKLLQMNRQLFDQKKQDLIKGI